MASFVLNMQLAGGLSIFALKLTNLFIHCVIGLLIFWLSLTLLRLTCYRSSASVLAVFVTGVWLLAPMNVSSVLYSIQRMAQLSALFSLLGLLLYVLGRERMINERPAWHLLGSAWFICWPLACLSKETGILLGPLILATEVFFFRFVHLGMAPRRWRQLLIASIIVLIPSFVYLMWTDLIDYSQRDFTLGERLLSQPRVIFGYLTNLLFPFGNDPGLFHDDFTVSTALFSPLSTLPSLLGLIILFAVMPVKLANNPRYAPVAYGLVFFLIGHGLESTVFPLEIYFEHRNYLPGFGIYFSIALVGHQLFTKRRINRTILLVGAGCYAIYFGWLSYQRAQIWQDEGRIYTRALAYHPSSPRALSNYAQLLFSRGQVQQSLALLDRLIEQSPYNALRSYIQKLFIQCAYNLPIPLEQYRQLDNSRDFGLEIELSQTLSNLIQVYQNTKCDSLDIPQLSASLDALAKRYAQQGHDPWTLRYYSHTLLYASGQHEKTFQRLYEDFTQGEINAGLYLLELLLENKRFDQIDSLLPKVTVQINQSPKPWTKQWLAEFHTKLEQTKAQ